MKYQNYMYIILQLFFIVLVAKSGYSKIIKKLENKEISDYEKKQYIIKHLMNKGYEYRSIVEMLNKQ